jgi:hypothetical protein
MDELLIVIFYLNLASYLNVPGYVFLGYLVTKFILKKELLRYFY